MGRGGREEKGIRLKEKSQIQSIAAHHKKIIRGGSI